MTAPVPTPRPKPLARLRSIFGLANILPLLVLAASLAVSYSIWDKERQEIERDVRAHFDSRVREIVGVVRERMLSYEQVLQATYGLFSASNDYVDQGEFSTFVHNMHIEQTHPGIQGIGFARVLGAGRAGLDLRTASVYYESFYGTNLNTIGADYFAEPSRRYAMEVTRDSGRAAISNKIKLPEEDVDKIQGGLRMYLPVYRNGKPHHTEAERRAHLDGWVYAAFSMERLLENILNETDKISLEVVDGEDTGTAAVFDSERDRVGGESDVKLLFTSREIEVGGYTWTLTARSLPDFLTPLAVSKMRLTATTGIAASLLLALFTWFVMRRRVRDRLVTQELRLAKDLAEGAVRAKSRFLAAASHDLRQPIHAQGLFLEVLARSELNPGQREVLDSARAASEASAEMLNTLLDFSRIEAGVIEPQVKSFHLQPLLNKIENELAPQADAKGLIYRTVETHAAVDSDPALVELILRNFVSNAIRYTQKGGILVGCRQRGGFVVLEVWDTGIGIDAKHRAEVFREFHQLGNAERDRRKGLGLGLAIAEGLARALGHRLELASRPGRGSVFRLTLPVASAAVASDTDELLGHVRPLNARILVIDDDEAVRAAMQQLLADWGCEVDVCDSIGEALALAKKNPPDLVISDYRLREQRTGAEAIDAVRKKLGVEVPALLVTGDTAPERLREAGASGIPLLHKPVAPGQLYRRLSGLVQS